MNDEVCKPRVIAANTLRTGCTKVERLAEKPRVRAGGGVHHRMRTTDQLQLAVVPGRPFAARVLAVSDLYRNLPQGCAGVVARKLSWITSQSPSWRLSQSLNT